MGLSDHRLAGIRVRGHSVAGAATTVDLPELKVAFDLGAPFEQLIARRTLLFTHAHVDHLGSVAWHAAMRGLRGLDAPTYVVPHENADDFDRLFEVWRRLDRSDLAHGRIAIGPGEALPLGRNLVARPFRSPHRVPCQGYALWLQKRRLKLEYKGLPANELRRLRQENVAIEDQLEEPLVVFTGDTRIDVVEREEVVRKAKLLVMEVTFLDDRVPVEKARSTGHVHLDEVIERAALFENEALLFTHFSRRYGDHEIRRILRERLPKQLADRVTPLLGT